ncbi:NAD(P)/FAD-dependent oxidoreductase [Gordonibacter massiliensis (ex Traore et al. 2017)]|uniref:NAD(P)/FAD-dependent oxidoreductase n=1 Tax=Gordonibacter massiliensis (ex Traore et al. 2017) TaxID=1841863 RepID=UPI001C8C5CDF|nr:FAD-binding protein [Gordonibacter massiliensis (ex Traore et al. 2017)]MBX9034265.1 FAD-binding protein [Gordonibacter massiliensis (ex Traore et al. 2017)]
MGARDTDVVIVGAGPAGIFCALALVERGYAGRIVMVDKGLAVEDRVCPKQAGGPCAGCEPCRITTGFSGAGAFSDGKLSLSSEVGGDLPDLLGHEAVQAAIAEVDGVYLAFGADERVEGAGPRPEVDGIRLRAIKAGLKLVDCPLRHLGTERARALYARLERHLLDAGVDLRFRTTCTQVVVEGDRCKGVRVEGPGGAEEIRAGHTVVATGRRGADWLERMCREHGIAHGPGPVDIGVRVEVRNEVMRTVNDVLYESKLIGYPKPFKNKVRTFCQNPGGFVSQENYDAGLAVVNGHSYKERKSPNTNLAILCSHNFSEPFDQPIAYAQKVGELTNMLGDGRILVQRLGDVLDGKRTWDKELRRGNVVPTLGDAVAGDITAAMPYRAMTNILAFMLAVDEVVPGFAAPETLLYSPELKFYSNRVKMDERFRTSVRGLRCLGDSSGWTRGLMMASVMGHLAGRALIDE